MRRVRIHSPGSYERLEIEEVEEPEAGPGEVRIAVEAIGVNYADCLVRMGLYSSAREFVGWPITPGFEVAGTVAALGEGVEDLEVGAPVLAVSLFGGYCEQVVAPRRQVFRRPEGLSAAEAAALPAVFLTASYALHELGGARRGQRMLVHSAAGGVGSALCQLGRALGCRTFGVVGGAHKVEAAREAGAEIVIDKSREDLWPSLETVAPTGFDLIFDANGVETLGEGYRHLAAPGRLVVYGFHTMMPRRGGKPRWLKLAWSWLRTPRFDPLDMTMKNRSVMAFNLSYLFEEESLLGEHMGRVLAGIEDGSLRPLPVRAFQLDEVGAAHAALESGTTVGKLVLLP